MESRLTFTALALFITTGFAVAYVFNFNIAIERSFSGQNLFLNMRAPVLFDNMCAFAPDDPDYHRVAFKVCYERMWLTTISPFSFRNLGAQFAKDNHTVLWNAVPIVGSDAPSFELLPSSNGVQDREMPFAQDKNHTYRLISDSKPPYEFVEVWDTIDRPTFRVLIGASDETLDYSKDKNAVYDFAGMVIPGADPNTFHLLPLYELKGSLIDARDAKYLYSGGVKFGKAAPQ
jgi:hypothetical protein